MFWFLFYDYLYKTKFSDLTSSVWCLVLVELVLSSQKNKKHEIMCFKGNKAHTIKDSCFSNNSNWNFNITYENFVFFLLGGVS